MSEKCPVCTNERASWSVHTDETRYECPRCGKFSLSTYASARLAKLLEETKNGSAKLSHALSQITEAHPGTLIDWTRLQNLLANAELPKPAELLDNFILLLGNAQTSLGSAYELTERDFAKIGVTENDDLASVVDYCKDMSLLRGSVERYLSGNFDIMPLTLTIAGWQRFEELRRGTSTARTAFMAMQFGDAQLDAFYRDHLRAAVAATGFELRRVDEEQPAGLIDDHLRVKIRQARFLIADLTHHNRGAYWEAGYAEGLGKPVIYTCRKDVFEDKSQGTHFDTNHHLTVIWDPANIPLSVQRLKDTIRATLPAEAVMED